MKIITSLLFFFSFTLLSFGQTDNLNQLDSSGKKDGKWIIYWDRNWRSISDSAEAIYYRYTFYSHGTNLYPMGPCGGKGYKLEKTGEGQDQQSKIKLLDGEYKWYDSKGKLSSIHVFNKGEYVSCKEYYSSGELNQYFDYTKKWQGQEHTWYLTIYDKKGGLIHDYYFRPDKNNLWPATR
jgi:hypothetical protein